MPVWAWILVVIAGILLGGFAILLVLAKAVTEVVDGIAKSSVPEDDTMKPETDLLK